MPTVHRQQRRRLALTLALATTLAAVAPPARGQQDSVIKEKGRTSKATIVGALGAIIGGLGGYAIGATSKPTNYSVVAVGVVAGGLAGWLIGRQSDELHAAQFHGVRPLTVHSSVVFIEGDPLALSVHDSLVAVGSSDGVQSFLSAGSLVPTGSRAHGLLGIAAVELTPKSEWLAVGTGNGLYLYPPAAGRGLLANSGPVAAIVASAGRVFSASGSRISITPVDADSTLPWPGLTLAAPVRALALDDARGILWAVTDQQLVAMRVHGDTLTRIGGAPIDGGARRVAASQEMVAVAVGERGVRLFNVADPAQPQARRPWTVGRFAYDVSLDGSRLFIAAGPDGVFVVELHPTYVVTIGVARDLGFASSIVSRNGYTYLLDGRTNSLRRMISKF
jgi:hypothetical protein